MTATSRSTLARLLAAAVVTGAGLTATAAPASAETQLLSCSGLSQIVSMNPPTGSSNAKYTKWGVKDSDGTKFDLLNAAIPADAFACSVASGIRTELPTTNADNGKLNPYDNQTNGAASLTTAGALAKTTMSFAGSGSCRTDVPNTSYPHAYTLHGKASTKFDQLLGDGKQVSMQSFLRLEADIADPEDDLKVRGIVTKGPGIGGEVRATIALFPTNSTKNINVIDCIAEVPAGDAAVAEMKLSLADGSDAGAAIDPWEVVIP